MTDDGGEWESLARQLLRYEFERHGERVEVAFRDAAIKIDRGESFEEVEIDRLQMALDQAEVFLETLHER